MTETTGLALLRKPFTEETWLPIRGFETMYSVSHLGRVRSERRLRKGKAGSPTLVPEKILRSVKNRDGHLRVALCDGATKRTVFVHALVLEAHVALRPEGMQACHNNGDPSDNRVSNLRWGTPESNQRDRIAHGTSCRGSGNACAKLSEAQVLAIRADSRKHADIAADHNVSRAAIGLVRSRKTWAHLGEQQ